MRSVLSIVVNVHVRSDRGRDYLRIDVPSHPERVSPDQPENRQKVADRILTFLRENPSASRREIAGALAGVTEGSVWYRLDKLKKIGRLRRVGPDRGGRWEVIEDPGLEVGEHDDGGAVGHRDRGSARSAISQKTTRKLPEDHQKAAGSGHPSPESASLSDRILSLLRRNPSASRREIAATLGATRSTVRYRLDRLRREGRTGRSRQGGALEGVGGSQRRGRSMMHEIQNVEWSAPETTQITTPTTQISTRKRIRDCLRTEPELTRRELAEGTGITPDGVKYHQRKLKAQGSIRRVGSDRAGRWVVTDRPGDDQDTTGDRPEERQERATTQNPASTTQITSPTTQITTQTTTQEKILSYLSTEPSLTRRELAERTGITPDGIKYHLKELKAAGAIRRVGSDRAGRWKVLK